jgi:hypothetical protein
MFQTLHIIGVLTIIALLLSVVLVSTYKKTQENYALLGYQWSIYLDKLAQMSNQAAATV